MSFVQGGGSAFSVYGSPIAKNAAVVGLSGEVGLDKNFALGLSYDGQFGSGNTDNAGSLFMKVRF
jgi:outer membrane autotransporter protein